MHYLQKFEFYIKYWTLFKECFWFFILLKRDTQFLLVYCTFRKHKRYFLVKILMPVHKVKFIFINSNNILVFLSHERRVSVQVFLFVFSNCKRSNSEYNMSIFRTFATLTFYILKDKRVLPVILASHCKFQQL